MAKVKDISGNVYNNLIVKKLVGRDKWGQSLWECECKCKNHTIVTVRAGDLKSGRVKSCGCFAVLHAKEQSQLNKHPNVFVISDKDSSVTRMYDNKGNCTLIDTEDIERLSKYCWYKHTNGYWVSYSPPISLHRFVMECPKEKVVDHIYFNKNDHRKSKLRVCSQGDNNRNNRARRTKKDSDLPVGVTRTKSGRFGAFIMLKGKAYQKTFDTVDECVSFRNSKILEVQ